MFKEKKDLRNMKKKKISFDLDEQIFEEIKYFCERKGIKLSDYWRSASIQKLEREGDDMTIYGGKYGMEEFVIKKRDYDITLYDAEPNIIELVPDAVHEGELRKKEGVTPQEVIGSYGTSLNELIEGLTDNKAVLFLTKEKYGNGNPQNIN